MKVTAECISDEAEKYGYSRVKLRSVEFAPDSIRTLHESVPYSFGSITSNYLVKDFSEFMGYDAIVIIGKSSVMNEGKIVFNYVPAHVIRFISECLNIPIIFYTQIHQLDLIKQNETDLFKPVASFGSLKTTVESLGLNSNSKVYVLNTWNNLAFVLAETLLYSELGLNFFKEY